MRYKKMRQDKTQTQNLFSQKEESGRSMIEMLGVLAIIGVLSIGAVWGYRYALSKYQSNEIIDAVTMRVITVIEVLEGKNQAEGVIQDGLPDQTHLGQPIESLIAPENPDYFKIEVDEIELAICRQILRDYQKASFIQVGDTIYNQDTGICGDTDKVTMGFVYKKDMTDMGACSEKGYFGSEDFQCHCSGNTYIDPYSNECICPAGHVWSAGENTCVESICGEGQFESLNNGRVSCDDVMPYTISGSEKYKNLCRSCPDRYTSQYGSSVTFCLNKNRCGTGQVVNDQGECFPCTQRYHYYFANPESQASCLACGNRFLMGTGASSWCIRNDACPKGSCYYFQHVGSSALGFADCAATTSAQGHQVFQCADCQDASGHPNRTEITKGPSLQACVRTQCLSGEFQGADTACYACSEKNKINIGDDAGLKSGCTACGREVTADGFCQLSCPLGSGILSKTGTCYPCSYYEKSQTITMDSLVDASSCEACGRAVSNGYCYNKTACGDSGFAGFGGAHCYPCTTSTQPGSVGWFEQQDCHKCPNRHVAAACINDTLCNYPAQFQNYVGVCYSCDYTSKVYTATHEKEIAKCNACIETKRFYAGSFCYRCDSSETPAVVTETEMDGCKACQNRQIKDGKCILNQ